MSSKKPADAGQTKGRSGAKRGKGRVLFLFAGVSLMVWKMPYAFVLLLGMCPSVVVWMLDRDKSKLTGVTVSALNLAAVVPLLIGLWRAGGPMTKAVELMTHPVSWVMILAGVLFGWIFSQVLPALVVNMIMVRERGQVKRMRDRQKKLVEDWGNGICEKHAE